MPRLVRRSLTVVLLVGTMLVSMAPADAASAPLLEHRRTVTYAGIGLQVHLGQEGRLVGTSAAFQRFVHHRLDLMWDAIDDSARCRPAPTVIVSTWMSDGFASAGEGVYAPCPGGGYNQLYVVRHGVWTAPKALASQEVLSCSLMQWFGIPRPAADPKCITDVGDVVAYRLVTLPTDYSTAHYAAAVVAESVENGSPGVVGSWTTFRVDRRLSAMRDAGATAFTVRRCFGSDDAVYGSRVGDARRGCLLDVAYPGTTASYVLRLDPARFGRWTTRSLTAVTG